MKNVKIKYVILLTIIFTLLNPEGASFSLSQSEVKLTIYTYDSLFADPEYDFIGNFSEYSGIRRDEIRLVRFSDAGAVLSNAIIEKDAPVADVLIGIDNAFVHQVRNTGILEPYKPNNVENLDQSLISELASDYLLTPYDYGYFALWFDKTRYNSSEDGVDFSKIASEAIASKLLIQDPRLSSPGLGFLLWSLAEYGHDKLESGNTSDWEQFWEQLKDNVRLTPSWGDALNLFFLPEANRSIMLSYTTSPAYGNCLYADNTTSTFVSLNDNNELTAWKQVEGIGLVNNSQNSALAKEFIDWFIGPQLQEQVYNSQVVYPALKGIEEPECVTESTINKDNIIALNSEIPLESISLYLDTWLDEWESLWNSNQSLPFLEITSVFTVVGLLLIYRINLYKGKKHKRGI